MRSRTLVVSSLSSLLSLCAIASAQPLAQSVQGAPAPAAEARRQLRYALDNLGVAVDAHAFHDSPSSGPVALLVPESEQGNTDLNGDGDATDSVVHVCDPLTGAVTNLGLAGALLGGGAAGRLAFTVDEAGQGGTDLNGDGDALDKVAFVHDITTGLTSNLGLAVGHTRGISSQLLVVTVSEADQGAADLNGDGDSADWVVFVVDLSTGQAHNLHLARDSGWGTLSAFEGLCGFAVSEAAQGADLDGDGLLIHQVFHVYDLSQGLTTNLGLFHGSDVSLQAGPNLVWFVADESAGHDFNGDGDFTDEVAHVFDSTTGVTTSTGYAVGWLRSLLTQTHLVFVVDEFHQGGVDLNGDGDALDSIVHARDLLSGTTTFAPFAWHPSGWSRVGDRVAFDVLELDQGGVDLNGNGDSNDIVAFLFDPASGSTANTALANGRLYSDYEDFAFLGGGTRYLGIPVLEAAQGPSDLDGDGDSLDFVFHFYDSQTGAVHNTGRGSSWGVLGEQVEMIAPMLVSESAWGGRDLNGDGDSFDTVLSFWHPQTRTTEDLPIAVDGNTVLARDTTALVLASEGAQGGTDLNGDGDANDRVLFRLRVQ